MCSLHKSVVGAAMAVVMMTTGVAAQSTQSPRHSVKPAGITAQDAVATRNPRISIFGGLATGDGAFDMGPALAASFNWKLEQFPVNFRLDPYFAYHTANSPDGSATFLGASANAEIAFATQGSSEPYLFGGAGLYYNSISIDTPGPGDVDDSGVDAGFGLGGGVRFGGFTLEAKMRDIDEFTTVSFLVGFMLGGR